MNKYTYSIQDDTLAGSLNSGLLSDEIENSAVVDSVTVLDKINTRGDVLDIYFNVALDSGQVGELDTVVSDHDGNTSVFVDTLFSASEGESTTSSTDFVDKLTVTITIDVPSAILCTQYAEFGNITNNKQSEIRAIHIDPDQVETVKSEITSSFNITDNWACFPPFYCIDSAAVGIHTFKIQYRTVTTQAGATARIRHARIHLQRI